MLAPVGGSGFLLGADEFPRIHVSPGCAGGIEGPSRVCGLTTPRPLLCPGPVEAGRGPLSRTSTCLREGPCVFESRILESPRGTGP